MNNHVDISIRQMIGAWQLMCAGLPGHTLKVSEGIEYIFSGLPVAFFNVVLLTQDGITGAMLSSYGQEACAWASTREVPWLFILTHEQLEAGTDAVACLEACGLAPMLPMTGMIAGQVTPAHKIPEGLELRVPEDDNACSAIINVNAAAYGMDLEAAKEALGKQSFWKDHFAVVGYVDGKPVSSATVILVDGYRYVPLVATDPDHQRRGYAEATLRRVLELSSQDFGDQPTVLHATDAGRPVYERIGYTPISTHTIFIETKFLEGH